MITRTFNHRVWLQRYVTAKWFYRNTNTVDVATCNNYVVGCAVGGRALLSATRYIFFLHCLEHYLRKLAPGSDINCCIAFTRIQRRSRQPPL